MAYNDLLSRIATDDDDGYSSAQGSGRHHDNSPYKYKQIDDKNAGDASKSKKQNGYTSVNMENDNDDGPRNPFDAINDNFDQKDDPATYLGIYNHIKADIKLIDKNIMAVAKLRDRFNLSDSQSQYQSIMDKMDDIMMDNSKITRRIKKCLEEEKKKNDLMDANVSNKSSSVLQWRKNNLNSAVRKFKKKASEFELELATTENELKEKEKRKLREFDEKNELDEQKINEMVDDPGQVTEYLKQIFEGYSASDVMLETIEGCENRLQGMRKIEQEIKELHKLWAELAVLVTEQQEQFDCIQKNVEQTSEYVKKGIKNLEKSEKKQKCTRKMGCFAICMCLIILLLVLIFVPGIIRF